MTYELELYILEMSDRTMEHELLVTELARATNELDIATATKIKANKKFETQKTKLAELTKCLSDDRDKHTGKQTDINEKRKSVEKLRKTIKDQEELLGGRMLMFPEERTKLPDGDILVHPAHSYPAADNKGLRAQLKPFHRQYVPGFDPESETFMDRDRSSDERIREWTLSQAGRFFQKDPSVLKRMREVATLSSQEQWENWVKDTHKNYEKLWQKVYKSVAEQMEIERETREVLRRCRKDPTWVEPKTQAAWRRKLKAMVTRRGRQLAPYAVALVQGGVMGAYGGDIM